MLGITIGITPRAAYFASTSSTRAEGGKNARRRTAAGKRAARTRVQGGETKAQLYKRAKKAEIPNRSKMTKTQLKNALKR